MEAGGRVKEFWPFLKAIEIGMGRHGSRLPQIAPEQ